MNTEGLSLRERLAMRTEVVLRARRGKPRRYEVMFMRPGGFMEWPGRVVETRHRKRVVAVVMFRKWFGHAPDESWQYWESAGASDRRGNSVTVEQLNNFDRLAYARGLLLPEKCGVAA